MRKWISVVTPVAVGLIVYIVLSQINVPSIWFLRFEFLLNVIITCTATICGFTLTAVSILVSSGSSAIVQKLQTTNTMRELRMCYTENLLIGIVVIVFFSFLGAVVGEDNCIPPNLVVLSASFLVGYVVSVLITGHYLLSAVFLINCNVPRIDNHGSIPKGEFPSK